jgi:uncharacterized protein (TIGR01777 family)
MRVLMAGSSGFLGRQLRDRLRADGHEVVRLVRREARADDEVAWRPDVGLLNPAVVASADAVINLAGTPLASQIGSLRLPVRRWTQAYRREFRISRVDSNGTLARAIAAADPKPSVFLAASGVGWYGDTGDTEVDEQAPAGDGFLADTCRVWEAATGPAEEAGVRVVRLRTGFPLHRDGGLLAPQLLPFRLGLAGRLGSGRQWVPWMSMVDWLDAVILLLGRDDLAGPVNLVGPRPVTNAEFTRALSRELRRPAVIPVPGVMLRTLLGEFGRDSLASKRVMPGVLTHAGFRFTHPDLPSALRAALRD